MAELVMRLPAITTEMDEGTLLTWFVHEGQPVKEGDPICEFTTDKVDTELESPYTGTITKLVVPQGGQVRVGDAIALIEGEAPNFLDALDERPTGEPATSEAVAPADGGEADPLAEAASSAATSTGVVPAPRAVRLEAERRGIDLAAITPTGRRGQVTMADLDAIPAAQPAVSPSPEASPEPVSEHGVPSAVARRPHERRGRGGERPGRRRRQTPGAHAAFTPASDPESSPDTSVESVTPAPITFDPALTLEPPLVADPIDESATNPAPVIHEVRVEVPSEPPFTLYTQLDITDLHTGQDSGLTLLARLVWAYGQALWEQPEANVTWDTQSDTAAPLDTVYVDLGIETIHATMETVPIAVPKDAPIAQIGLSVINAYGLVRQGTPPSIQVPQRSASLVDLGPWRVERFTPMLQPPQVTAVSVGEIQTIPSLVGRTVTIRQMVTIGLTINTRVLDPVQAASLLATIVDHATHGDGISPNP